MEAELTGEPNETSNNDNYAVAEEKNVDEAITEESKGSNEMEVDLKYKQNIEDYEETINIYIENINTIEKRNKVYTKEWRKIYEVLQPDFLKKTDIFPDDFIRQCKDNTNEAQFLPLEVKNNIKRMAMKQELYAQVVKLRGKDLGFTSENKNKNETDIRYSAESRMYCSAQPSVFSHILINDIVNTFFSLRNEGKLLLCAVLVAASSLI